MADAAVGMTGSSLDPSPLGPLGSHTSAVLASDEEWAGHVARYLRQGLERGEQLRYFADAGPDTVTRMLAGLGPDIRAAVDRGQLTVLAADETYLAGCSFDPDRMIGLWHEATAAAVRDGYPGLRAVGEVSWYSRGVPGADRLLEYELRIHREVFERLPVSALCVYDRRLMSDSDVAVLAGAHTGRLGPLPETRTAVLRVRPLPDRPGFSLAGDATFDSRHVVAGAAEALSRLSGNAGLDVTRLGHIDVAGAARLAAAAARLPGGHVSVLGGAPPSLQRLLKLFPELSVPLKVEAP